MGRLRYDRDVEAEFEDRTLAHLQLVIGTKLRRRESFYFSWKADPGTGEGRTTIWMHPGCSLVYKYYGSRVPKLNMMWIDALAYTANAPSGLYLVPEPDGTSRHGHEPEPAIP